MFKFYSLSIKVSFHFVNQSKEKLSKFILLLFLAIYVIICHQSMSIRCQPNVLKDSMEIKGIHMKEGNAFENAYYIGHFVWAEKRVLCNKRYNNAPERFIISYCNRL